MRRKGRCPHGRTLAQDCSACADNHKNFAEIEQLRAQVIDGCELASRLGVEAEFNRSQAMALDVQYKALLAENKQLRTAAKLALTRLGELNRDDEAGIRMVLSVAIEQPEGGDHEH